jgi:hypothetical protein
MPTQSTGVSGSTIEMADKEGGQLIVNNNATYTHMLVSYAAKSKMLIEAKENRFRITLTDLGYAAKPDQTGYWPIQPISGSGWQSTINALTAPADKISTCITERQADNW